MKMKTDLKILLAILCIAAMILPANAAVFAETNEALTAKQTVRISIGDDDKKEDNEEDVDPGEMSQNEEDELIQNEDGASEKSGNPPVERMDITQMTEVRIGNFDEWCDFANKCMLDSWSVDKYVILTDNIDCRMKKFIPVPLFSGVFDGNGYTINKAACTDEQNYIGIFSKTTPTAVIRNVNVIGVMKPAGKPFDIGGIVGDNAGMIANCKYDGYVEGYDYIGGIAGYNETTGTISACHVTGKITGLHHVGGICGANIGLVTGCSTKADVNTVTKEVETSIKDIKVEELFTSLVNKGKEDGNKMSLKSSNNPVDIGGIVGHNIGEVSSCINESTVGYEHVGYNVGGIAGRQSGYLHDCTNSGNVQGRKDVAGIVGQAEPYIRLDLNSDIISQISKAITELHDSVDVTIKDTDASAGVVSARLNVIKGFADNALTDTGYLANSTQDYVNGVVSSTNEIVGRIEYVISESSKSGGAMEHATDAGRDLRDTAEDVEKVVEDLDIYKYLKEDERKQYDSAKANLKSATEEYSGYYASVYDGYYHDEYAKAYYEGLTGTARTDVPSEDEIRNAEQTYLLTHSNDELEEVRADAKIVATNNADTNAKAYANNEYTNNHGPGSSYIMDVAGYADTISRLALEYSDDMVKDVKKDGKNATKDLKKMATDLKDAGSRFKDIMKDVAGRESVRFPQLSEEYRLHTNSLVANIQGMSDNLGMLNNEMKGSTDTVCTDLEGVNDKFQSVMLLFTDAMDGALDMDYSNVFEDNSDDVCQDSVDATIADCENSGSIYGDINTGGIAGTMAQEYDFDLEGDLTGIKDTAKKSVYKTKCVLRGDRNRGAVKGKKSYVGGACGLQEIGTIIRCSNYAKVSSESSDYVGGIAGRSYSSIRDSYEKGVISGASYVGGITGAGDDITDCVAMPNITAGKSFTGAIAGTRDESGKLSGNYFVSDTLAGVDRISIAGGAEPVAYGQLMGMDNIPSDFALININFIVDDKVVATMSKRMGDVVTPEEMPEENDIASRNAGKTMTDTIENADKIVLAADEYINWDCDEDMTVSEDTEITGKIERYTTTLASDQTGPGKQSIFLVDGRFVEGDKLTVMKNPSNDPFVEEYMLLIPGDGELTHLVRYQMSEDPVEKVYEKIGDEYTEVKLQEYGKYNTFTASGNEVTLRIEKKDTEAQRRRIINIVAVAGGIILLIVIIKVIRWQVVKRRQNRKPKKEKSAETKDKKTKSDDA